MTQNLSLLTSLSTEYDTFFFSAMNIFIQKFMIKLSLSFCVAHSRPETSKLCTIINGKPPPPLTHSWLRGSDRTRLVHAHPGVAALSVRGVT